MCLLGICHVFCSMLQRLIESSIQVVSIHYSMSSQRFLTTFRILGLLVVNLMLLVACKHDRPQVLNPWVGENVDSVAFKKEYHYWRNFNFITTDTIRLSRSTSGGGEMLLDTSAVLLNRWDAVVVTNINSVPSDSVDSMWVMLARDAQTMGWVRAKDLSEKVVPDNVISRCIALFSSWSMLLVFSFIGLGVVFFGIQNLRHARFQMVHVNDIKSFYPTLLCLVVSSSAVLYGAIQQFAPEMWATYYYDPTLNPFAVDALPIRFFLLSVWALLIVLVAVVDDVFKQPAVVDAVAYLASLFGVCMALYLFFTQSVHIYVGYPVLIGYWYFALRRHFQHNQSPYRCGQCGAGLNEKGKCPKCGAINE